MRITIYLLITFLFICNLCYGAKPNNIELKLLVISDKKETYKVGDSIKCKLTAIQSGKYCNEGVQKIRVFVKGLNIEEKKSWKQLSPEVWEQELYLKVVDNKKGILQLTAYRRTDKGEIIKTLNFKLIR